MKLTSSLSIVALLLLTACGGNSTKPTYSGHQESTEGVPGFSNGKKTSPYAKLGQSYTVAGETYVPRYQPGYVEEGLASWYGPGFHGGKTANGEEFNKEELTGAHRTLPLPSMVKVTLLETGKTAIVRINDRGPFSKGRIIDLSRAAAEKIGLIGRGVGKVRVEYLGPETERFAELMSAGRDPKSIDIESEVLNQTRSTPTQYANNTVASRPNTYQPAIPKTSWAERLNPISTAHAETVSRAPISYETVDTVDSGHVSSSDLAPPVTAAPAPVPRPAIAPVAAPAPVARASAPITTEVASPFDMPEAAEAQGNEVVAFGGPIDSYTPMSAVPAASAPAPAAAPAPVASAPAVAGGQYFQLGAFANQDNAERLRSKVASIGTVFIDQKVTADNTTLYVVRMGPYADVEESSRVLAQLNGLGINPKPITK